MTEPHENPVEPERRISLVAALEVLALARTDRHVVVTNQGSARVWPQIASHSLDFHYVPSAMGGAIPFALGLALAKPDYEVITVSGDGSLLMSLGCLVTVAASQAANITIVLIDNGVYEVTGGQKTPASTADVDYAGLARAAGFPNVAHFWDEGDWHRRGPQVLVNRGPRFVWLQVEPIRGGYGPTSMSPLVEQVERLRQELMPNPK
jgi:thiamine pyrophosphate-dependent acetolactate synthase large subunit-like protein